MLVLGVSVATWILYRQRREREFRLSLTPGQHYIHSKWLCTARSGLAPSASDVKAAIHHHEVIPADSAVHAEATYLLAILRVLRDRPKDFAAEEKASFQCCIARIRAVDEAEALKRPCQLFTTADGKCIIAGCSTGVVAQCAPLARGKRVGELMSLPDQ